MQLSFSINATDLGHCLTVTLFLSMKQLSWSWTTEWKVLVPPLVSVTQSTDDMLIKKSLLMAWPCSVRSGFSVRVSLTELLQINSFFSGKSTCERGFKLEILDVGRKSQHLFPPAFSSNSSSSSQVPSEDLRSPFVLVPALSTDANRHLRTVNYLVCQGGNLLLKMGYDL